MLTRNTILILSFGVDEEQDIDIQCRRETMYRQSIYEKQGIVIIGVSTGHDVLSVRVSTRNKASVDGTQCFVIQSVDGTQCFVSQSVDEKQGAVI